jgi:predicted ribosomally synthesized peptide with SipW-like signal peptide
VDQNEIRKEIEELTKRVDDSTLTDESIAAQSCELKRAKKSFKKSLASTVAFAVLTIVLFSAQTYAYFTSTVKNDNNKIASGILDVSLIEMTDPGTGEIEYVNPVEIMPATSVSKIVKVKNSGDLPVFIRMKIDKSINKPENTLPADWEALISCDIDTDVWTYKDGYYYYNEALESGSVTIPLFKNVYFSADMGNEFTNSQILFTVRCEATQRNGNGEDPLAAQGWPAETSLTTSDGATVEEIN